MGCVSLTLIHLSPTGTLPGTTVDNLEEIWPPFQIWKLKTIWRLWFQMVSFALLPYESSETKKSNSLYFKWKNSRRFDRRAQQRCKLQVYLCSLYQRCLAVCLPLQSNLHDKSKLQEPLCGLEAGQKTTDLWDFRRLNGSGLMGHHSATQTSLTLGCLGNLAMFWLLLTALVIMAMILVTLKVVGKCKIKAKAQVLKQSAKVYQIICYASFTNFRSGRISSVYLHCWLVGHTFSKFDNFEC